MSTERDSVLVQGGGGGTERGGGEQTAADRYGHAVSVVWEEGKRRTAAVQPSLRQGREGPEGRAGV